MSANNPKGSDGMQLDDRKTIILQAIIRNYLETGEPVGSRTISKYTDLNLSSATIRNEMADLEELGYILQPHTSAGRIPSDLGYRYYVNCLMEENDEIRTRETEREKEHQDLINKMDRMEEVLKNVADVLAANTNYATLISAPQIKESKLKFIQLSMVDSQRLLVVIVVGNDTVKNVLMNMDEPLGMAVGNILEVKEAIDTLKGNGPDDFVELIETLASHMLILGGAVKDFDEGLMRVRESIQSGKALDKFKQFVAAQGGDTKYIDHPELFEQANIIEEIRSEQDGFVGSIDAQEMGICSLILGGGRETKESVIDPTVGLVFSKKVADPVKKGDVLATIYGNDEEKVKQAVLHFKENYHIIEEKPTKPIMIREVLS